jgi:RND family efflux transporter MFP subunit
MNTRTIIIASTVASTLVTTGCQQDTTMTEPVRPVLSTVFEAPALDSAVAVGTVEPRFKTDLGFRVLGRLIKCPVSVGDMVAEGQVVAAIDSTALELAVRSARAELSKSQAQLANASATEERKRTLIATNATTKQMLDDAEQARAGAEAAVAQAKANLTKGLEQLSYAEIKADFAAVVTSIGADVGQVVSPGRAVVTVARPDIREAVVDIGPDFPVPLKVGLPFTVSLQLLPTIEVHGTVREIAPQADAATRTYRVRIALTDPPPTFRLGSTITARLSNDQTSNIRLPESAVLAKDGQTFVWAVDLPDGTVSLRKVDVSHDEHGMWVKSGLAAGTRVVTAGIHSLNQGQHVRIEQESTP